MISNLFHQTLTQLCIAIDLQPPNSVEQVISLKIGPYVCSLTEHPVDHILMFMELEPKVSAASEEQNMYCQDLCKPVIGRDPVTGMLLLWNRQPMHSIDRAQVHHQLDLLVAAAQDLSGLTNV